MEYTIDRLARMAGVSARTLRYYDQMGLLKPARVNASGYRIYGRGEVDRLQQILLYRALGLPLKDIAGILDAPGFSRASALRAHAQALTARRAQLDDMLHTVERTIQSIEEDVPMNDKQKFEGFKRGLIDENERTYGKEARERYGNAEVDESNRRLMNMREEDYDAMQKTEAELFARLKGAVDGALAPDGDAGAEVCRLHKAWLSYTWPSYSPEAHKGLAQMYAADPRFTAYYDVVAPGCAAFLKDAIDAHAE